MLLILEVFQGPKAIGTLVTLGKRRSGPIGYRTSKMQDLSVTTDIDSPLVSPSSDSLDQTLSDPLLLHLPFVLLTCHCLHEAFTDPPPAWRSLLFFWVRLILSDSVILYLNMLLLCVHLVFFVFIYSAGSGLSCSMRDLSGSFTVACSFASCGSPGSGPNGLSSCGMQT